MIQVDMSELCQKFYNLGKDKQEIIGDNAEMYKSLDAWQRIELMDAYNRGKQDA